MIEKVLIFNYECYNQLMCTIVEGLKAHKHLELYSTIKTNYSSDIVIKSPHSYEIDTIPSSDGSPRRPYISASIIDEDGYIDECEELMDECDLIIIMDDNLTFSSAYFENRDGQRESHLQEYATANHRNKIAFLGLTSLHYMDDKYTTYGDYAGGHPVFSKVYFKREKDLDLEWPDNVVPFPRASEERYFAGGKNFNKIWDGKSLDVASLFRATDSESRIEIKKIIKKHYGKNKKCNVDLMLDGQIRRRGAAFNVVDDRVRDIDKKIYGFENNELDGTIHHHYSYFDTLLKSKISIECPQHTGFGFYTYRMWESIANGCCYFYPTPTYNVDFPNGLIDGEDFVIYHSPDELIEKIEYYLSHEEEMRTIAENGFNKLLKYHTSEVRAKEFIETCEKYMND